MLLFGYSYVFNSRLCLPYLQDIKTFKYINFGDPWLQDELVLTLKM